MSRRVALAVFLVGMAILVLPGFFAPEFLTAKDGSVQGAVGPLAAPPLGTDSFGRPLLDFVQQGSRIVAGPSLIAALIVMILGALGGLLACTQSNRLSTVVQVIGEILGALPRLVVVIVVVRVLPEEWRGLMPIAIAWALLTAPGAMDEAASVASRLGGSRFVEAMRAHGFSRRRIYLVHILGYNLRPVLIRQAAETFAQVIFLEMALSYVSMMQTDISELTHGSQEEGWAGILYDGYSYLALNEPTGHSLLLGLALVALVLIVVRSVVYAGRAR